MFSTQRLLPPIKNQYHEIVDITISLESYIMMLKRLYPSSLHTILVRKKVPQRMSGFASIVDCNSTEMSAQHVVENFSITTLKSKNKISIIMS